MAKSFDFSGEDFYSKDKFDNVKRLQYEHELELKAKKIKQDKKLNEVIVEMFNDSDE